tara:strand:+ start:90 stop:602 length:513 start_codon:yes stop_codon:yes gene_type:complete
MFSIAQAAQNQMSRMQNQQQYDRRMDLEELKTEPMLYAFNRAKQDDVVVDNIVKDILDDRYKKNIYKKELEKYENERPNLFRLGLEGFNPRSENFKKYFTEGEDYIPAPEFKNFNDPSLYSGATGPTQLKIKELINAYTDNTKQLSNEELFDYINKNFKGGINYLNKAGQ